MKPLLLLSGAFLLASCAHYQYHTVTGEDIPKSHDHEFVTENDTVRVVYRFDEGRVRLWVHNKTTEPIAINWKKSALVQRDEAVSYFSSAMQFRGTADGTGYRIGRLSAHSTDVSGQIERQEELEYIPPGSAIRRDLVSITAPFIQATVFDTATRQSQRYVLGPDQYHTAIFRTARFGPSETPLSFRSFLAFDLGKKGEYFLENRFYVSEVVQSASGPANFPYHGGRGDRFFVSQ